MLNPLQEIEKELAQLHIDVSNELVKEQAIFQTLTNMYKLQLLQYANQKQQLDVLTQILAAVNKLVPSGPGVAVSQKITFGVAVKS